MIGGWRDSRGASPRLAGQVMGEESDYGECSKKLLVKSNVTIGPSVAPVPRFRLIQQAISNNTSE